MKRLLTSIAIALLMAICIRYGHSQVLSLRQPVPSNSLFWVHVSLVTNAPVKFCWECSTNSPDGPWWSCSATQTIAVNSSIPQATICFGTNVTKGFIRFHGIS